MKKNTLFTIIILIVTASAAVLVYVLNVPLKVSSPREEAASSQRQSDAVRSKILALDVRSASEEGLREYRTLVRELAVGSGTIIINKGCMTDPLVLKVKLDDVVMVSNTDTVEHRLSRPERAAELVVPPQGSVSLRVSEFVNRQIDPRGGSVRYGCDTEISGVLFVFP